MITLSILFILLMTAAMIMLIANYKESIKLQSLLNDQDILILEMEELNKEFKNDLK